MRSYCERRGVLCQKQMNRLPVKPCIMQSARCPAGFMGEGLGFGAGLWLIADEVTVPALKLSKPSTAFPSSMHVYGLASHLVNGRVTEQVRRAVRRALYITEIARHNAAC